MYRHIPLKQILSIKYYTEVPINTFKRWSLPSDDNLMRQGDLYRLLFQSIKEQGLLDPVLCYDIVNVHLDNPPVYHGRKIWGLYLIRGNIRWLCCKDLGIPTMNAIVAQMDYAQQNANFNGTEISYQTCVELETGQDINELYVGYNPQAKICKDHIDMQVPSLTSVEAFGVSQEDLHSFREDLPTVDYTRMKK